MVMMWKSVPTALRWAAELDLAYSRTILQSASSVCFKRKRILFIGHDGSICKWIHFLPSQTKDINTWITGKPQWDLQNHAQWQLDDYSTTIYILWLVWSIQNGIIETAHEERINQSNPKIRLLSYSEFPRYNLLSYNINS